ncbi:MAG: efflux RND transporter periplasmic adaptor subunit [Bacteroidia bacterium]|nr:efflux RND transporter periplasmic adaptor subunit [Bacteroidia bacterium]
MKFRFLVLFLPVVFFSCKKGGMEVETALVEARTIYARVEETGTIQPTIDVPVAPDVSGEVVSIAVREGEKVKKGELLLTIRPDDLRAQLEQAVAALNQAKAAHLQAKAALSQAKATLLQDSVSLARTSKLFKDGVVSQVELENAQLSFNVSKSQYQSSKYNANAAFYQIKSAEATKKQARQSLDRTNIYASMDGTVTLLTAEVGQRVVGTGMMSGSEILKIADLSSMEVLVQINENSIVDIALGQHANIEVDAFPNQKFTGRVTEIAYSANTSGVATTDQVTNFDVKVALNPDSYKELESRKGKNPFRPGMTAIVEILTDTATDVTAVPIEAVGVKDGKEVVYKFTGGTAQKQEITIGLTDNNYIEVTDGLEKGVEIVVGPSTLLRSAKPLDGMEVSKKAAKKGKDGKERADGRQ